MLTVPRLSMRKLYSTIFYQTNFLFKLSGQCKKAFKGSFYESTFSKPYVDVDILSSTATFQNQKIPEGIKIQKNGQLTVEGDYLSTLTPDHSKTLLKKFKLQGLHPEILDKYDVKINSTRNCMFFPLYRTNGDIISVRCFTLQDKQHSLVEDIFPRTDEFMLFGWLIASHMQNRIIITSNTIDAMIANQETNTPAIAMYFKNNFFPSQFFNLLQRFHKIILWLSSEHHNWRIHKLFLENLGKKAFFIRPQSWISPFQSLQNGVALQNAIADAYPLKHESVETFSTYKEAVYSELHNHEKASGMKWRRFPVLNELLKGHRSGELTIFSGQTGTGKTTFMSEYSLDLCIQGLPTLWGSFEVKNTRLIKTMFTQFSLCSLLHNKDKILYYSSEFEKLPMFFMNFNGNHTLRHVIEAMSHTVVVHSIQHVVIDNLQFMMNVDDLSSGVDMIRRQDIIFGAFRRFATQHDCHVTLVMHPRKEPEFTELNNTSISGSAKAIQEADNIILLQSTKMKQYLQVTKNRFDGEKGCVLLEFNKDSLTFNIRKVFNHVKSLI